MQKGLLRKIGYGILIALASGVLSGKLSYEEGYKRGVGKERKEYEERIMHAKIKDINLDGKGDLILPHYEDDVWIPRLFINEGEFFCPVETYVKVNSRKELYKLYEVGYEEIKK